MDWNAPAVWWLAAGALVAAELATGTFYLLMFAVGAAAGAVAAHAGTALPAQLIAAALVGFGAVAGWHWKRSRGPRPLAAADDAAVNLDIGQHVRVDAWQLDGSARVHYRGAAWSVRYAGNGTPEPGEHTIVAVHGAWLSVAPTY